MIGPDELAWNLREYAKADDKYSEVLLTAAATVDDLVRRFAAAVDALDYAHSEGFQWPVDPFCDAALAFADIDAAIDRLTFAYGTCVSCDPPHPVRIEHNAAIADTHAKRGDATQIAAPFMSGGGARQRNRPKATS